MIDPKFASTMNEIEIDDNPDIRNRRDDLNGEISKIQDDLNSAEAKVLTSESLVFGQMPISPEQANEMKKEIVFLKKDLDHKKTELKELDS